VSDQGLWLRRLRARRGGDRGRRGRDLRAAAEGQKREAKKRKSLPPIRDRIDAALKNGPLCYTDLWNKVFPADLFPRRGGTPSRGGPPGSYMALSYAIDKHGFKWSVPDGGTLATRIVYPRSRK